MVKYSDGLDDIAQALACRGRRQIVARLNGATATSSELADLLGIGLPAVQKHLSVLHDADLITSIKRGRTVTHSLKPASLASYADWLRTRQSFWNNQLDALTEHLEDS